MGVRIYRCTAAWSLNSTCVTAHTHNHAACLYGVAHVPCHLCPQRGPSTIEQTPSHTDCIRRYHTAASEAAGRRAPPLPPEEGVCGGEQAEGACVAHLCVAGTMQGIKTRRAELDAAREKRRAELESTQLELPDQTNAWYRMQDEVARLEKDVEAYGVRNFLSHAWTYPLIETRESVCVRESLCVGTVGGVCV